MRLCLQNMMRILRGRTWYRCRTRQGDVSASWPLDVQIDAGPILTGMLERVIKESCSLWATPIVLVRKKDGSWRLCVDYRKLTVLWSSECQTSFGYMIRTDREERNFVILEHVGNKWVGGVRGTAREGWPIT